jgi:hypothetical protein
MPNKRKIAKLRTRLLSSGKLNSDKNVMETLKIIQAKAELDREDINFDFENVKNPDFEKLADNDDDTKKLRENQTKPKFNNRKRKNEPVESETQTDLVNKKSKQETSNGASKSLVVPKKSKKNKYFFIAHPEVLDKKESLIKKTQEDDTTFNQKFVIDKEKIKLNEMKKLKKKKKESDQSELEKTNEKSKQDVKKKTNKKDLWTIEECSSSSDDDEDKQEKRSEVNRQDGEMLDILDIDKSFKLKKKIERMPDGSMIETFVPEYVKYKEKKKSESKQEDQEIDSNEKKEPNAKSKSSDLLKEKLQSSRFRYLNEMLYSQASSESFNYFKRVLAFN